MNARVFTKSLLEAPDPHQSSLADRQHSYRTPSWLVRREQLNASFAHMDECSAKNPMVSRSNLACTLERFACAHAGLVSLAKTEGRGFVVRESRLVIQLLTPVRFHEGI